MSANNGIIRIGRKGTKKFAFGDDAPFEVDVVVAFQQWIVIDDSFRPAEPDEEGDRRIPVAEMPTYHQAGVQFVKELTASSCDDLTVAEALDFIARLREQYDELAVFFRPKLREEPDSPATSEAELRVFGGTRDAELTPFDELVLQLTMPKVQAWEQLNNHEYCSQLNMAQFHALLLKAGYSEEAAQKAANKRGWDRLSAGVTM